MLNFLLNNVTFQTTRILKVWSLFCFQTQLQYAYGTALLSQQFPIFLCDVWNHSQTREHPIPEDLNCKQQCCGNLHSQTRSKSLCF